MLKVGCQSSFNCPSAICLNPPSDINFIISLMTKLTIRVQYYSTRILLVLILNDHMILLINHLLQRHILYSRNWTTWFASKSDQFCPRRARRTQTPSKKIWMNTFLALIDELLYHLSASSLKRQVLEPIPTLPSSIQVKSVWVLHNRPSLEVQLL